MLFTSSKRRYRLTHWGRDKMAANFQTTFSNAFCWMTMYEFRLRFHWSLFPMVQLTICHYLNQWWFDYRRIYACLGLHELNSFQMFAKYSETPSRPATPPTVNPYYECHARLAKSFIIHWGISRHTIHYWQKWGMISVSQCVQWVPATGIWRICK